MRIRNNALQLDDPSRRQFMAGAARGLLGLASIPLLSRYAPAADSPDEDAIVLRPASARNVIYLYMLGGMTQLDTFDPKPGTENQGPTQAIGTNVDGVQVSQHFPHLSRQMDKVCVINSLTSNQGAHSQGRYYMHTSYRMRGTIRHPSLGAWLLRMGGDINPTLPGHVVVGGSAYTASAGFMNQRYMPLPIDDPEKGLQHSTRAEGVSDEAFERRMRRLARMNAAFAEKHDGKSVRGYSDMYDQAVRLMKSSDLEAFDLADEPESLRAAYGPERLGQGCLLARRLVERGVRFVEVVHGGWDTHSDNFDRMEELCPPLDRALSTLLADLSVRGLLEETLVVVATEFGRTPKIVPERRGRNHYPNAFSCLLAGGGVRGGQRYGRTNETGEEIVENPVTIEDFNATIAYALGLPLDHLLYSPSGRPFTVANKGQPVTRLFA